MRYDSTTIHEVAERLYSAATLTEVLWTIAGVVFGFPVGWLAGIRFDQQATGLLLGAAFGVLLGYWIGHLRALTMRFTAQMALCQAQIEENTRPASAPDTGRFSGRRGTGDRIGNALGR